MKGLLILLCLLWVGSHVHAFEVTELKCESLVAPGQVTSARPRFSWTFVGDKSHLAQGGYRICMASDLDKLKYPDIWDSGPTSSTHSQGVEYRGEPLQPGQRVYWCVTVWSQQRGSATSEPSWFDVGELADPEQRFVPAVFPRKGGVVCITLDGNDKGRTFEGIGAVSAGASTDLLYDYQEPVRGHILDLLFRPKFGASFQHLKVEMGGGENSTCGSEPSHAISRDELANPVARGYEFWLMREARNRNPEVILECLPWSFPGWLKPDVFSQESAEYFAAYLAAARDQWGLEIDWVAAAENENGTDRDWLVNQVRPTLDAKGFTRVKIQGPDDNSGDWRIFEELQDDPEFDEAIDAVGYHYVTGKEFTEDMVDGRGRPATAKAKASGKPLWASEDWSWKGEEWGGAGALNLARLYNKFYIRDRITKTLIWAPVGSIQPSATWDKAGAMRANRPWSGYYEVWPAIWATAHTTQFATPDDWRYLDGGCGLFDPVTYKGSCVAMRNKTSGDWSMIICTDQPESLNVVVQGGLRSQNVHVWKSDAQRQFVQLESVAPRNGRFSLDLESRCIYTLTTTDGQRQGAYSIPKDAPFPVPYREDYEGRQAGDIPRYHSDQKGSFEIARRADGSQCLKQICPQEGYEWMKIYRRSNIKPHTLVGDVHWKDFTCSVEVLIDGGDVELAGRVRGPFLRGYRLALSKEGEWRLAFDAQTLASGSAERFDDSAWHKLQLGFRGEQVEAFLDGRRVAQVMHKSRSGCIALASSYDPNLFDNLEITPSYSTSR